MLNIFNFRTVRLPFLSCFLAIVPLSIVLTGVSRAQTTYTTLTLRNRVQITVPEDWTINDAAHRQRVQSFGDLLSGMESTYTAALSVHSTPSPVRVIVRVSFVELDQPITQSELQVEYRSSPEQLLQDLAEVWAQDVQLIRTMLNKAGMHQVGQPSFSVEQIGGKLAMVFRYGRSSAVNSKETMRVAQFHVPLGKDKVLITLSYIEESSSAKLAHDRVRQSILIKW
jgi:hypothetical protein